MMIIYNNTHITTQNIPSFNPHPNPSNSIHDTNPIKHNSIVHNLILYNPTYYPKQYTFISQWPFQNTKNTTHNFIQQSTHLLHTISTQNHISCIKKLYYENHITKLLLTNFYYNKTNEPFHLSIKYSILKGQKVWVLFFPSSKEEAIWKSKITIGDNLKSENENLKFRICNRKIKRKNFLLFEKVLSKIKLLWYNIHHSEFLKQ